MDVTADRPLGPRARKDAPKSPAQALYVDDVSPAGMLHGVTVRSPIAARPHHGDPLRSGDRLGRVHDRHRRGHSRAQRRHADRSTTSRTSRDERRQPPRGADRPARAPRSRPCSTRRGAASRSTSSRCRPVFTHRRCAGAGARSSGATTTSSRATGAARATSTPRSPPPPSSSRVSTRPARRSSSTSSRTACSPSPIPAHGVTVWGSMQCPYYVHKALAAALRPAGARRIRVVQMETGGGFGGKEEYPSMIAGHAALLAWKSGRPVKMIYDRDEDMAATTKRHPSRTRHRTARRRATDGSLAMDIDFVIDGGAYCTLSPVVLSRGTIHAAGPYSLPERARPRPRRRDQHAAARRVPRLRRAAEHLRARAPHGPRRGGGRGLRPRSSGGATSSRRATRSPSAR